MPTRQKHTTVGRSAPLSGRALLIYVSIRLSTKRLTIGVGDHRDDTVAPPTFADIVMAVAEICV